MIIEKKINKEFRPDGSLIYFETLGYLDENLSENEIRNLFKDVTIDLNGKNFIRIGECEKYHNNGQLAWRLIYDDNGNVIRNKCEKYTRNGESINY